MLVVLITVLAIDWVSVKIRDRYIMKAQHGQQIKTVKNQYGNGGASRHHTDTGRIYTNDVLNTLQELIKYTRFFNYKINTEHGFMQY